MRMRVIVAGLIAALMVTGAPASAALAADAEESATELAKTTQNPVTDLISVPFQNNVNFDTGSKDATVSAVALPGPGEDLRERVRSGRRQPDVLLLTGPAGTLRLAPGPTFTLSTATDSRLGSGEFGLGPAAWG